MRLGRPPKKRRRVGVSSVELLSNDPAKPQEESEATGVCEKHDAMEKNLAGQGNLLVNSDYPGPVFFRVNLARLLSF